MKPIKVKIESGPVQVGFKNDEEVLQYFAAATIHHYKQLGFKRENPHDMNIIERTFNESFLSTMAKVFTGIGVEVAYGFILQALRKEFGPLEEEQHEQTDDLQELPAPC